MLWAKKKILCHRLKFWAWADSMVRQLTYSLLETCLFFQPAFCAFAAYKFSLTSALYYPYLFSWPVLCGYFPFVTHFMGSLKIQFCQLVFSFINEATLLMFETWLHPPVPWVMIFRLVSKDVFFCEEIYHKHPWGLFVPTLIGTVLLLSCVTKLMMTGPAAPVFSYIWRLLQRHINILLGVCLAHLLLPWKGLSPSDCMSFFDAEVQYTLMSMTGQIYEWGK